MKALFHRIQRGVTKEKDKDSTNSPTQKEKDAKLLQLPPLPEWPPPQQRPSSTTPNSIASYKPLPDLTARPLPPIDEPSPSIASAHSTSTHTPPRHNAPSLRTDEDAPSHPPSSSRAEPDSTGRSSRKTTNGSVTTNATLTGASEVQKKVAFISPPPTPAPQSDRPLPDAASPTPPSKTTVSRFQATHGKDPRGSTSTGASTSKTDLHSSSKSTITSVKATSTRTAVSPHPQKSMADGASIHQSLRSGTPYSQLSNTSSRILAAASWSEGAEEDLVSNLGPRERTRQEVLWEIVASEERYVGELMKMKETFLEPLLHPFSTAPSPTPYTPLGNYEDFPRVDSPQESADQLPIAARFMSPTGFRTETPPSTPKKDDKEPPNIDGESLETDEEDEGGDQIGQGYPSRMSKHNHPRSPYRASASRNTRNAVAFPSRSHQSLPPPPRSNQLSASTHSLGRQSVIIESQRERNVSGNSDRKSTPTQQGSRVLRKFRKSQTSTSEAWIAPHLLPDDLRICLEVVESGIIDGHQRLSEGLRKRYDEQYPLVRSLADVFVANSHIFNGYATYVLHLERALEQVDNGLSNAAAAKKPKNQDSADWLKVCKFLQKLEADAQEKGETGLAISLSKPFQRLLKYPLLFQNLLFHTDPSTFEYESTLQMVAEVETIVRSIEDEKIQKEDRDKTRDVFARIEGLDKVKQLSLPKPSRVLVEERLIIGVNPQNGSPKTSSSPPPVMNPKNVKGKTSFKRLSDVLQSGSGVGGKKDLWLVVFNDVVLRCQRTGTTSVPLVAATNSRTNSLPELQGKAKYATTGRRNSHTRPRNLYKFIKIETWAIGDVVQPREGVVSMEDVVRSKNQFHSNQPKIVPMPEDDEDGGAESDDSDRKSKMSFSYWGADKVTIQKPVMKPRQPGAHGAPRRGSPIGSSSYGRESSANAKFGTRLVSNEHPSPPIRPASRRTQGTPVGTRKPAASDDGSSAKATVTRPAWDSNTRAVPAISTTGAAPSKRPRATSQTSSATRATTTNNTGVGAKQLASPAPSDMSTDSGVGFYRQMMAQDPSLNRD
ncbi:hypothetical protein PLICRDRAFT_53680 [Plicaturopsis crispa FD-325 SS-3]|nr:hypothetical protein PLICRDRAFT_53680 [Plicaturopsis crispa FD-325 SS-3]